MTIAEYALLAAVFLILLALAPAKVAGHRDFNNETPRDPGFYTPGLRARALGAHMNGIEAFPLFATAVLLAEFRHVPQTLLNELALLFVALRLVYVGVYWAGWGTVRSLVWGAGLAVNIAIFLMPLWR